MVAGVDTAHMIHGYTVNLNVDPTNSKFKKYGDIVDVGKYHNETHLLMLTVHKGALPSTTTDNEGNFLFATDMVKGKSTNGWITTMYAESGVLVRGLCRITATAASCPTFR